MKDTQGEEQVKEGSELKNLSDEEFNKKMGDIIFKPFIDKINSLTEENERLEQELKESQKERAEWFQAATHDAREWAKQQSRIQELEQGIREVLDKSYVDRDGFIALNALIKR